MSTRAIFIAGLVVVGIVFVIGLYRYRFSLASSSRSFSVAMNSEADREAVIQQMTLAQKIGQMTLVQKNAVSPQEVTHQEMGALLSGGGGNPSTNTPAAWAEMVQGFQDAASRSSFRIPILYGVDAVHGNGNVNGATIFPQNIGLAAAKDVGLMEEIGRLTAREMKASGINWNFAPVLSSPRDLRWGRVYETFGSNLDLITKLAVSYQKGLQAEGVLATPKHFVGEGLEKYGTSKEYKLDQGEIIATKAELMKEIEPFHEAIKAGAMSLMISRSSWQGKKMSANKELLTDLLKTQFGFQGFLVSDWGAIDQISSDQYANTVTAINAGIDMVMVPDDYNQFIANVTTAVERKDISQERIDDAVRRILRAKASIGLFSPEKDAVSLEEVGSTQHREVARTAVQKSLVLLKNENQALPLKNPKSLLVVGRGADDIGFQSGGWTLEWQGTRGNNLPGTSILGGLREALPNTLVTYVTNTRTMLQEKAEVAVVAVGEEPYAEGVGDREQLGLSEEDQAAIAYAKRHAKKMIILIVAGRPLPMTEAFQQADAVVMTWLPGSEGEGIADVLVGKQDFTGTLPIAWEEPKYPVGFGRQMK